MAVRNGTTSDLGRQTLARASVHNSASFTESIQPTREAILLWTASSHSGGPVVVSSVRCDRETLLNEIECRIRSGGRIPCILYMMHGIAEMRWNMLSSLWNPPRVPVSNDSRRIGEGLSPTKREDQDVAQRNHLVQVLPWTAMSMNPVSVLGK
jgi:hypothetical protein